ncbi:MAG: HPr family phosphocarrier protein [Candidatus Avilachnospira sp.]|jgi:phosphotransferase system HPr (HPr) family protein
MLEKKVAVGINEETENRPALLVQKASNFDSKIHLECGNKKVNAKSIMGMMALGLCEGDIITITAEGADENEAVKELEAYLTGAK